MFRGGEGKERGREGGRRGEGEKEGGKEGRTSIRTGKKEPQGGSQVIWLTKLNMVHDVIEFCGSMLHHV